MTNQDKNELEKEKEVIELPINKFQYMKDELIYWARVLIIIGSALLVIKGITSSISPLMLLIIGVVTLFIIEPAMYIIIGAMIIMLSIMGSISGEGNLKFALIAFQLLMAVYVINKFNNYKDYYTEEHKNNNKFLVGSYLMLGLSVLFFIVSTFVKYNPSGIHYSWFMSTFGVAGGFCAIFAEQHKKYLPLLATILNICVFVGYFYLAITGKIVLPSL